MPAWKDYQEEVAEFFRSLGADAETDMTVKGVRTEHDVDVFVRFNLAGFTVAWIVECKHWKTAVSKLHVLALRAIVADLGADRGILLCEEGFQSGAVEAANLTNVQVISLATLAVSSKDAIYAARLRELYDRIESCRARYWDIPKDVRIRKGLRFEVGEFGYSGARVIEFSAELLSRAFRGLYPINAADFVLYHLDVVQLPRRFATHEDVVRALDPLIADLEAKLTAE